MIKYQRLSDREWLIDEIHSKPLRQIAGELDCSYSAVVHASRKFGIKVPHRIKNRQLVDKSENIKLALKKKYPAGRHGDNASNWRGGRRLEKGYIRLYMPDHPLAVQGSVFEHRLVAENKLGRLLTNDEVVHHLNGIKTDNCPENLEVMKRGQHIKHHYTDSEGLQKLYKRIEYLEQLLVDNSIPFRHD